MPALRRALRRACRHAAAHAPVILLAGANHALLSGSERREGDLAPELDAAAVTRCAAGVLGDFLAAHAGTEPCAPAAQGTLLYLTLPQFTLLTLLIICPCPPCSPRRWRSAGSCLRSRLPRRHALPNWHVLVQSCFSGVSAVLPRCWRPVRQSRGFVLDTLDCVSGAALAAGTRAASHSKGRTVAAHRIRLLSTYMAPGACH